MPPPVADSRRGERVSQSDTPTDFCITSVLLCPDFRPQLIQKSAATAFIGETLDQDADDSRIAPDDEGARHEREMLSFLHGQGPGVCDLILGHFFG